MSAAVQLAALTAGVLDTPRDVVVTDVTLDSRMVGRGALFLACRGARHHAVQFAPQALARGARAVLYEAAEPGESLPIDPASLTSGGPAFVAAVPRLTHHVGEIADRFFGSPSRALSVAGVTGTNGKTTCAFLLAQALTRFGRIAGYMGTLGWGLPDDVVPFGMTTADVVTVHRQLAELKGLGAECVGMEVTSHALEQTRVDGVRFHLAAFTNLTRDHLDYHGSMQAYGAAKARLFARPELTARIINVDDPFGLELARQMPRGARLILTSRLERGTSLAPELAASEYLHARRLEMLHSGLTLHIDSSWGDLELSVPLIGEFNADNVLTVLGMLLAQGVPLKRAAAVLATCAAPPGRMEVIRGARAGALAIVDFAHTPDALAKALQAARAHTTGRLRVVFGCGGDRDVGKRPLMGAIAERLADELVLTDDNPRSEDPRRIVADIRAGIARETPVQIEHDRAAAIRGALARSSAGDVVLIAGKGHEGYQIYGTETRAFSDQQVALACFETAAQADQA